MKLCQQSGEKSLLNNCNDKTQPIKAHHIDKIHNGKVHHTDRAPSNNPNRPIHNEDKHKTKVDGNNSLSCDISKMKIHDDQGGDKNVNVK